MTNIELERDDQHSKCFIHLQNFYIYIYCSKCKMKILFKMQFFTDWYQGQADTPGGRDAL